MNLHISNRNPKKDLNIQLLRTNLKEELNGPIKLRILDGFRIHLYNIMQQESFNTLRENIVTMTNNTIGGQLGSQDYSQDSVQKWTAVISEELVKALKGISQSFKFCVSCLILQKGDAGMHMSSTCYWDSNTDGSATIKWENSSMYCIVNIFGVAF